MSKIAVVTGAGSGLGLELTKELSKNNVIVYAIAREQSENPNKLKELTTIKNFYPNHVHIIKADLSTEEGITNVINSLKNTNIDYLVNNAALSELNLLKDITFQKYQNMFTTNVITPLMLSSQLNFNNQGRIINMYSNLAFHFIKGLGAYSITKSALNIVTKLSKIELGIPLTISFIPGVMNTKLQQELRNYPPLSKEAEQLKKFRIEPSLVAQCISWLLRESSPSIFLSAETIYNQEHHKYWLKPGQILPPPPEITKRKKQP